MNNTLLILVEIASSPYANSQNLPLFGGAGYTEYLGCMDCSKLDSKSSGRLLEVTAAVLARLPYGTI
ncbi:hypothetical protein [Nonlabens sp.]|uniref:hypothetical protein n=1 Tax=Nonlabens sp. TaxID=1888209 RepID=UPI001BCB0FD1|nr:hypothetical protein [Nonlabens sp.]